MVELPVRTMIAITALASLMLCAACAEKPAQSASLVTAPQQFSSIHWDELAAARQSAHVTNNNLIMMR